MKIMNLDKLTEEQKEEIREDTIKKSIARIDILNELDKLEVFFKDDKYYVNYKNDKRIQGSGETLKEAYLNLLSMINMTN